MSRLNGNRALINGSTTGIGLETIGETQLKGLARPVGVRNVHCLLGDQGGRVEHECWDQGYGQPILMSEFWHKAATLHITETVR
jgi:hypothetical protein